MGTSERPGGRNAAIERADTIVPSSVEGGEHPTVSESPHAKASGSGIRARATALSRGTVVSRYVVIDLIGAGGMGRVYAAYDPELSRQVALKVVSPGEHATAPDDSRTRLMREAQAMARVSHPNVIPVFDVGTFDGDVFVAMELRHGRNLAEWLRGERSQREIIGVFVQAGRGLAAAHAVGLVHRDFKPDNVHVGDDRRVCVLDFGLARPAGDALMTPPPEVPSDRITPLPSTALTIEGALIGTPQYMAPEQHRREAADARTDQFSFCVALYEALCGQRPYLGKTVAELGAAVIAGRITRASRERELPTWLRTLIMRGLSVRPEDRYPSMEALLRDLDRQTARRRGAVLVAAAVLVAGAGIAYAAWPRDRAPSTVCTGAPERIAEVWNPQRAAVVRTRFAEARVPYAADSAGRVIAALDGYASRWAAMSTDACRATRVREERSEALLDRTMVCLDRRRLELDALARVFETAEAPVVEQAVSAAMALVSLDTCMREGDEAAPPPGSEATVAALTQRLADATAMRAAGKSAQGLEVARAAAVEARALGYGPLIAETVSLEGLLAIDSGDSAGGVRTLEDAYLAATAARMDALAAQIAIDRVYGTGYSLGKFDEANALARVAEAAVARLDDRRRLSAELDIAYGGVLSKETRYDESGPRLERAAATFERLPGLGLRHAQALVRLATMRHAQGRHSDALALFERAAAEREALLGPEHPVVASTRINVAAVAIFLGNNQEAIDTLDRAWPVLLAKLGPAHPNLAKLLNNRGLALARLGRFQEAFDEHQRSLTMLESLVPADSVDLTSTLINLGVAAKNLGRHAEALAFEERCLAIYEKAYGAKHVELAYPLTGIGVTWLLRGEPARALPPLERAWKLRESTEVDVADRAETRFALARARWETGSDRAGARALAEQARQAYTAAVADNPTLTKERDEIDVWLAAHGL